MEMPVFSHESQGQKFYKLFLRVPRLSGTVDTLPVILRERLYREADLTGGENITVSGSIRSHNLHTPQGRRLLIFLFADTLLTEDGPALNEVTLCGNLCREPNYRRTPLGREICDVMLAVPRPSGKADYLPCILWGSLAQKGSLCHVGNRLGLEGRLQSRIYTKLTPEGAQERTAYEISALTAETE